MGVQPSLVVPLGSALLLPVWTPPLQLRGREEEGLFTVSQFTLDLAQRPSPGLPTAAEPPAVLVESGKGPPRLAEPHPLAAPPPLSSPGNG